MEEITLNIKPLSVNQAYANVKRGRIKTVAYKKFEAHFLQQMFGREILLITKEDKLKFEYEFGFSNARSDLSNPLKAIEDCLAKYYSFNDNQVDEIRLKKAKVKKGEEYIKFKITILEKNDD